MSRLFEGEVVVITGGSSGIGRATALAFAREGAKVSVASRRSKESEETVRLVKAEGGDAMFVQTDVTKAAEVEALIARTSSATAASTTRSTMPASRAMRSGPSRSIQRPPGIR